ncbi:MAG: YcgL domain-containing protein [Gammaproteobacteria bacterium]|nr:YcgL domain-containing protein [Gammaproteobacteria bacterium]
MKEPTDGSINCWIYSSPRQDQMYLYLQQKDGFDSLPGELLLRFGPPRLVMELTLHSGRKLARENVLQVMRNLRERGYHLQLPPKITATLNDGE